MLSEIDHEIFFFLNSHLIHPVCDTITKFFIQIPGQICIAFIGAICLFAGRKYTKFSSLIFLSAFVIARYSYKTIKLFVQRPRPFHALENVRLLLGEKDGFSFPSGHATTSFCLATAIAMRYPKLRYPIFIVAIIIALSRPYVGVHYPSDILVGAILGIFIGYIVTKTASRLEAKP